MDESGLAVPGETPELWTPDGWKRGLDPRAREAAEGRATWPVDTLLGIAALAQHYGVPTRLLDWTRRPLVAAWFAARGAAEWVHGWRRNERRADSCAVWCLNLAYVAAEWPLERPEDLRVQLVSAPSATNPNLFAQGGVFTLDRKCAAGGEAPTWREPLDQVVLSHASRHDPSWYEGRPELRPAMRRLALPLQEAPRLLRLLADENISAATTFPGLEGAVKGLEERRLWDR